MVEIIETFAGPGGWSEGARLLSIDSGTGLEIDSDACATARAAGHKREQLDVTKTDPRDYRGAYGSISSPVCKGFSNAGNGKGNLDRPRLLRAVELIDEGYSPDAVIERFDERSHDKYSRLALEPLRWALSIRPRWLAWEQVPAVLPLWEACAQVLRKRGWYIWTGVLRAEQYGVPQTRKRAVLIASTAHEVRQPPHTHSAYHLRAPDRLDSGVLPWVSIAEALGWDADTADALSLRSNFSVGSSAANTATERGRSFRSADTPSISLTGKPGHWVYRSSTMPNATHRPGDRPGDRPAPTIAFGNDANSARWVPLDGGLVGARVSVREAAALQSFRGDYPWQGSKTSQYQQVANAVPPVLAAHILAMAIGNSFDITSKVR